MTSKNWVGSGISALKVPFLHWSSQKPPALPAWIQLALGPQWAQEACRVPWGVKALGGTAPKCSQPGAYRPLTFSSPLQNERDPLLAGWLGADGGRRGAFAADGLLAWLPGPAPCGGTGLDEPVGT